MTHIYTHRISAPIQKAHRPESIGLLVRLFTRITADLLETDPLSEPKNTVSGDSSAKLKDTFQVKLLYSRNIPIPMLFIILVIISIDFDIDEFPFAEKQEVYAKCN